MLAERKGLMGCQEVAPKDRKAVSFDDDDDVFVDDEMHVSEDSDDGDDLCQVIFHSEPVLLFFVCFSLLFIYYCTFLFYVI